MSAGLASFYGTEAQAVLKHRMKKLFARYHAQLAVTIISIQVQGPLAFDWGWHKLTLKPKKGGKAISTRNRYLEIWQKGADGSWKIAIFSTMWTFRRRCRRKRSWRNWGMGVPCPVVLPCAGEGLNLDRILRFRAENVTFLRLASLNGE